MGRQSSYRAIEVQVTVAGALEFALSEAKDLQEMCETAAGNFPNSSHPKAEEFSNSAEELQQAVDDLEDITVAEPFAELNIRYWATTPRRRSHSPSKASRASNSSAALSAVFDELKTHMGTSVRAAGCTEEAMEVMASTLSKIESAQAVLQEVTFPGMFG